MPLPMVHLGVAKQLVDKLAIENIPNFYLGSIAPDGIYTRKEFTRDQKLKNHLIPEGRPRTVCDILDFWKKHRGFCDDSFILGYTIHVLTDQLYNESVYKVYLERYDLDPSPIQDKTWAYYNDTDIVDFELFTKEEWRAEVWKYLEEGQGVTVEDYITAEEAEAWRDRTLHWYDRGESEHKNPVKYITYEDETSFINEAADEIYSLIENCLSVT